MNHKANDTTHIDSIIVRYLMGSATYEETEELLRWIEQSEENKKVFFEQQDIWESLHPTFDLNEIDIEKAEKRILMRTGIEPRKPGFIKMFLRLWPRVAAVLMLPLLALLTYYILSSHNDIHEIVLATSYGCTSNTVLPDGTKVWLNANSSLVYPSSFSKGGRNVILYGEAYFDVKADTNHPFNVHTSNAVVTATGTEFNVNAYEPDFSVSLIEGKVNLNIADTIIRMSQGEQVTVENGKPVTTTRVNLENYCAWRSGTLIFDNEPLIDICNRLKHIYNIEFFIAPEVADKTFHMTLKGESINEVLHLLQLSAPVICTSDYIDSSDSSSVRQKIYIKPS